MVRYIIFLCCHLFTLILNFSKLYFSKCFILQIGLREDIDDCKGKNKKVDDDLQQAKDSLTEKLDKEIKEVSLINGLFRMSICICVTS